jgi:benzodiazapine receptor
VRRLTGVGQDNGEVPALRSVAVAATAVAQVLSSPVTLLVLGPAAATGTISDANRSPVTPAGYAFAIWGLIYAACLALAVYQLLPSQRDRPVHRRTGWWLAAAFTASTVWVPVFGTRTVWLSQLVILALVAFLAVAATRAARTGPAGNTTEELLLRLPVTLYLGWATMASAANFGATFRSLGMPARSPAVTAVSLVLLVLAGAVAVVVVARLTAVAGFTLSACWALVAVAVATDSAAVRAGALVVAALVLALLVARSLRSRRPRAVLLG